MSLGIVSRGRGGGQGVLEVNFRFLGWGLTVFFGLPSLGLFFLCSSYKQTLV